MKQQMDKSAALHLDDTKVLVSCCRGNHIKDKSVKRKNFHKSWRFVGNPLPVDCFTSLFDIDREHTSIRVIQILIKRELPPVMAGVESLGMGLTVPRARTLQIITIIHQ